MTTCGCGRSTEPGDAWCGGCGRRVDGDRRQPETVTVAQTLLVLSAVGAALGLLVAAFAVSAVISFVSRLGELSGVYGGALEGSPAGLAGTGGGAVYGALGLAVLETLVVVGASIWAFRALGRRRGVARHVLAAVAGLEALLTVATLVSLDAPPSVVVGAVVAGLLVLDAPVLVLLWAPAASRTWFAAPEGPAVASRPAAPAAAVAAAPAAPRTPPQQWAPPLPSPRPAPSGAFPRVTDADDDPVTEGLVLPAPAGVRGRHSTP